MFYNRKEVFSMFKVEDEALKSVSGGAMRVDDYQSLYDYLRLEKDMGSSLEQMMKKVTEDYNNKLDYYDLLDDAGNPLSLETLQESVKKCWEELGY